MFGSMLKRPLAPGAKVPDRANARGRPEAVGMMNLLSIKM